MSYRVGSSGTHGPGPARWLSRAWVPVGAAALTLLGTGVPDASAAPVAPAAAPSAREVLPSNCVVVVINLPERAPFYRVTCSWTSVGESVFTMPDDMQGRNLHVTLRGARGGDALDAEGGAAAQVTGQLPVSRDLPKLYVEVGGRGGRGGTCLSGSGGWNGGADGGQYCWTGGWPGGGGGGATDLQTLPRERGVGGQQTAPSYRSRLVVAAGGGGAGGKISARYLGGAGGAAGEAGVMGFGNGDSWFPDENAEGGGGPGTSTSGGRAGQPLHRESPEQRYYPVRPCDDTVASPGELGNGGDGAPPYDFGGHFGGAGGGGGGGLYGGGGGAGGCHSRQVVHREIDSGIAGGGGGGGSSLLPAVDGAARTTAAPAGVSVWYDTATRPTT